MPTSTTGREGTGPTGPLPDPPRPRGVVGTLSTQGGFTLLELLIALTLGALLLSAAYASFHAAMAGRERAQRTSQSLSLAKYVFATFSRDVRRLHEECADEDFSCQDGKCLFPILDANGEKIWVRYRFANGELRREQFAANEKAPGAGPPVATTVVAGKLSRVVFQTQKTAWKKDALFPRLITIDLNFEPEAGRRERFTHAVYVETTPRGAATD
ncbi:MAG: prepilin-type N-terminal cleavage/methylation domain-containing protein [Solidesulfovibrio sp.]